MIEWNLFNLQNGFSPIMEEFILFHDYLMMVLMFILSGVMVFMLCFFGAQFCNRTLVEGQFLEALWTILPALALISVALPSLSILYNLDTSNITHMSLKVLGHQWYWSYEYSDFWAMPKEVPVIFDSYMMSENDLDGSLFRLLDADNSVALPCLSVLFEDMSTSTYITVKSVDSCPQYKTYSHENLWITSPIFSSSEDVYVTPESTLDSKLHSDDYIMSKSTLDSELYSVLGIDERAVLPYTVNSQVLIDGGADGAGTWYLPGVQVDWESTPGRMRNMDLKEYHLGLLYGECHPICGSGLNLLPVVRETVYQLESPPAPMHPPTLFYYALDLE